MDTAEQGIKVLSTTNLPRQERQQMIEKLIVLVDQGVAAADEELSRKVEGQGSTPDIGDKHMLGKLRSGNVASETISTLLEFNDETLAFILSHVTTPTIWHDRLHTLLSSYNKWAAVLKDQSEAALRDLIFLRHMSVAASAMCAYSMLEAYDHTGIAPGEIYMVTDQKTMKLARGIFALAKKSRRIEINELYAVERTTLATRDQSSRFLAEVQKVTEAQHVKPELVSRLRAHGKVGELLDYMDALKVPSRRIDLEHFLQYRDTAKAVAHGVL